MKKILRVFGWLVVSCAILFGAYFVYERWWGKETAAVVVGKVKGEAVKMVDVISGAAKETVGKVAGQTIGAVGDFVKDKTASALVSVGEKLSSLGSSIVGEESPALSAVTKVSEHDTGGIISKQVDGEFPSSTPIAAITTKINIPLVFSINRESSYIVRWGDGVNESGEVLKNSSKLVSHIWSKKGDYVIRFELKEKETIHAYSFPVMVYD